ncbi:MBL fold metallo-hydrolase [Alkalihalobacillus sp. BA299]|uniref:MBL fold metallo-hydrolase n=1 Tax=Alkalihalobacillus sp. BA299 TaxID=2815938 RepID=UPI001ADA3F46|nr:MBL fold metallo-hydrolase [Alkalihalobacillus sp. BA299]
MEKVKNELVFFGGLHTVGGVHVLFGRGNTGLMFDFGLKLTPTLFNHAVKPHPKKEIQQLLYTRLAPPILGLYDVERVKDVNEDGLQNMWKMNSFPEYSNLQIFISHMHQDHMALLPYAKENIPVYMHNDAHSLYKGLTKSNEKLLSKAKIVGLEHGEKVTFEDFELTLFEVDHNSPGTSGFILESPEYTIAFTGDWRWHGRHPERIDRFIQECKQREIDVLITEGTRIRNETLWDHQKTKKEQTVLEEFTSILQMKPGKLYVNVHPRDVERLVDFMMLALESGRSFVLSKQVATTLYHSLIEGISVLKEHPIINRLAEINVLSESTEGLNDLPFQAISTDEIKRSPEKYCIHCMYEDLPLVSEFEVDVKSNKPSYYVHADSPPLRNNDPLLLEWLKNFNVEYHYLSNRGHAQPEEVSYFVNEIKPKVVIPLHSPQPSLLVTDTALKYCPYYGESVIINELIDGKSKGEFK